ncbi:MAG: hypothetical protein ROR55_07645 [Devosia sp.]
MTKQEQAEHEMWCERDASYEGFLVDLQQELADDPEPWEREMIEEEIAFLEKLLTITRQIVSYGR